jgi:DNA gyrase subunit A
MDEFTVQKRGGKGVKCYKITDKTGDVINVKAVNEDNEVMLITTEGIVIRIRVEDISIIGRITSGVKLIDLKNGVKVARMAKVRERISNGDQEFDNVDDAMEDIPEDEQYSEDFYEDEEVTLPKEEDEDS